jgi:Tol biopolymer transport system component
MEAGESSELVPNDGSYQDYAGTWNPNGEQVVIYSNRTDERYNFYTVDIASGETTQLTEYENNVGRASYDPTGRYLLYNRYVVDTDQVRWEIRALDTTNQNEIRVGVGVTPHWSPDGQWIAYTTESEPADVFVMPATCIYENTECNTEADAFNATYTPDITEREPLWSPDQTQLVYLRDTSPEPTIETWDIFRQDLRTGQMQNLTNTSDIKERHSAWEPVPDTEPVDVAEILPVVLRVSSGTANTRAEPTTGSSVVTVLNNGQIIFAQGTNAAQDWYRITIPGEGVSAWIFGDLVAVVSGDPATLSNVQTEE